jgi:hypothetical protein
MADWRKPSKARRREIREAELVAADESTRWMADEKAKLDAAGLQPDEYANAELALELETVRRFRRASNRRLRSSGDWLRSSGD